MKTYVSHNNLSMNTHSSIIHNSYKWNNSNIHYQWVYKQNVVYIQWNVCMLSHFSCVWLFATLWTIAHQAPLSMGFSTVVGCHATPGDLPNPRTEPVAPADSLPLSHRGSPQWNITWQKKEWSADTCYNLNELLEHHTTWKKSVTNDHIL